jgi:hypothetical protein
VHLIDDYFFLPEGLWLFRRWMQSFALYHRFLMASNSMVNALTVCTPFWCQCFGDGIAQSAWVRPKSQTTQHLELFLWGRMSQGMVALLHLFGVLKCLLVLISKAYFPAHNN